MGGEEEEEEEEDVNIVDHDAGKNIFEIYTTELLYTRDYIGNAYIL